MWQPTRSAYVHIHLDTNRINSRQAIQNINILEQWANAGVIHMELSEVAQNEVLRSYNIMRRRKALGYLATETLATTNEDQQLLRAIELAIFPIGAHTDSERRDVEIVFNAKKYSAILVTNDGASKRQPRGLLGSVAALRSLDVTVMSDADAVEYVRSKISDRDRWAREAAATNGTPLPDWVGAD